MLSLLLRTSLSLLQEHLFSEAKALSSLVDLIYEHFLVIFINSLLLLKECSLGLLVPWLL